MHSILVYRGIKSDGIIYRGLPKYRGIPSGGIDVQQAFIATQFISFCALCFMICVFNDIVAPIHLAIHTSRNCVCLLLLFSTQHETN